MSILWPSLGVQKGNDNNWHSAFIIDSDPHKPIHYATFLDLVENAITCIDTSACFAEMSEDVVLQTIYAVLIYLIRSLETLLTLPEYAKACSVGF